MELNYKTFGAGSPLIILHGLFGMLDNWQTMAKFYAKHQFEVYILDLRNHGRSPHSEDFNYPLMARDILDFLEEQNIFKTHIIGHSMGGKVALQFCALYPGYVDKLIVADIFPKTYNEKRKEHEYIFRAIDFISNTEIFDRKEAENNIKGLIPDERLFLFMMKNLTTNKDGRMVWKFNAQALINHYNEILSNVVLPKTLTNEILFLKASESDYIIEAEYWEQKDKFPNSTIINMPNTGHWLHVDQPEEFRKHTLNFLNN